ncbi:type II toxin-antitoxin system VapC family toxin [Frankia sp. CiP3]|uniref:type II toxin-antitoxin system VapC family toxin n=1 Tax=Frankia sp. CiP3 TaxID=2880971 RepID=UPI001EF6F6AC|nr:type II toxin-antitoxin system VapC family toxin [Frankia sp. CiP3]
MSLVVIDASALVAFYAVSDPRRPRIVARFSAGHALFAPAHLDVEVTSALRGLARGNPSLQAVVPRALRHLAGFPIRRMPIAPLLERMWQLRENVTPYDAAYVALAERLDSAIITCDAKLAAASGIGCIIDLIAY